MRSLVLAAALFAGLHVTPALSQSVSLRVSPVLVDLSAPTAASSLRISNDAKRPISVQVRIFKWSQKDGVDTYTPATDVAVSPPISQLKPGAENMVRVVRTSKRPVKAEESYRLIVDELPAAGRKKSGTVTFVVRHSIPVFFSPAEHSGAQVAWSAQPKP
ncbi:molecular chaperone, partial [Salmonella enterica subsp. enterica serovar Alachua]|nr:molecular chaperone [Salmonella enterica subsp. enterica serovar Alachua]